MLNTCSIFQYKFINLRLGLWPSLNLLSVLILKLLTLSELKQPTHFQTSNYLI